MDIREKRKKTAKEKTEMQDNRKLSTDAALSSVRPKKREAEKRHSPHTPYREKGKGKETSPGSSLNPLKPARAYAGTCTRVRTKRRLPCTCSYSEAGDAAYEIVANCFGTKGDFALWAFYCRHFNRRRILDKAYEYASMCRNSELRDPVTAFQAWLRKEFATQGGAK